MKCKCSASRYPKKKDGIKLGSTVDRFPKVGMILLKYTRIEYQKRWCARMFQSKNVGTSLDKNDMMFSEGIQTMYLYAALCTMNPAKMFQARFLNWFLDRNATVNQERSVIRFQMRSTSVYPDSHVLKLQKEPRMEYMKMLEIKKNVEKYGIDNPIF